MVAKQLKLEGMPRRWTAIFPHSALCGPNLAQALVRGFFARPLSIFRHRWKMLRHA
jgi:hypothetical protein